MVKPLPINLIADVAKEFGVSQGLICAVCEVESSGETYAVRFEPAWKLHCKAEHFAETLGITLATEKNLQAMSWGLMQVMGTVARELGFVGHLPKLCRPNVGLHYGAKKMKLLLTRFPNIQDAISAYNAGTPRKIGNSYVNQGYVDKVMRAWDNYSKIS